MTQLPETPEPETGLWTAEDVAGYLKVRALFRGRDQGAA